MTLFPDRSTVAAADKPGRPIWERGAQGLATRLREEASRTMAFSETKLLLREAAWLIERLDRDAARQATEVARLNEALARQGGGAPAA